MTGKGGKPLMTDAQVLEARALQDFADWSLDQVQERFPQIQRDTLKAILDYRNRSRLIPKEHHLPTGVEAV
jgi:uncharacterized protein (DUF433 family)